jgi:hypothetical protein
LGFAGVIFAIRRGDPCGRPPCVSPKKNEHLCGERAGFGRPRGSPLRGRRKMCIHAGRGRGLGGHEERAITQDRPYVVGIVVVETRNCASLRSLGRFAPRAGALRRTGTVACARSAT